jgi:hypothetical protein
MQRKMDLNLELFEEGSADYSGKEVHVTINQRGNIFFNRRALEALGNPDSVALMYDRRRSIIGIQPVPPSRQCAFPLQRKFPKGHGRKVSAKNFAATTRPVPTKRWPSERQR